MFWKLITKFSLGLLLCSSVSFADTLMKCSQQPNFACAKTTGAIGVVSGSCTGGQVVGGIDANGNVICVAGGSGPGGVGSVLAVATCVTIDGSTNVFFSLGSCVDLTETAVEAKITSAMGFGNLNCRLSGNTGSESVTIRPRTGACASVADTAAVCTIGPGTDNCSTATGFSLTAGQCLSFRISSTSTFGVAKYLSCTFERTS